MLREAKVTQSNSSCRCGTKARTVKTSSKRILGTVARTAHPTARSIVSSRNLLTSLTITALSAVLQAC